MNWWIFTFPSVIIYIILIILMFYCSAVVKSWSPVMRHSFANFWFYFCRWWRKNLWGGWTGTARSTAHFCLKRGIFSRKVSRRKLVLQSKLFCSKNSQSILHYFFLFFYVIKSIQEGYLLYPLACLDITHTTLYILLLTGLWHWLQWNAGNNFGKCHLLSLPYTSSKTWTGPSLQLGSLKVYNMLYKTEVGQVCVLLVDVDKRQGRGIYWYGKLKREVIFTW